ncbi:hypothetical protein RAA17_17165 [Komagataeibacter rhaeticus]|nr:hypothetical protein [Komagataeibacter rhaeticus]
MAIAATGDELLLPGSPVGTGQIANSNTPCWRPCCGGGGRAGHAARPA